MKRDDKNTAIFIANEEYVPWDPAEPERNLLRAILMSALNDIQKQGTLHEDAKNFFLNDDEDYVFSFRAICDHLEIDPKHILVLAGLAESMREHGQYDSLSRSFPLKFV